MTFTFVDSIPENIKSAPILISGKETVESNHRVYLTATTEKSVDLCFEIRYDCHTGLFKQATILDNLIAVGFEEYFYLFSIATNTNLLRLRMEWYFGHLYIDNELFYVADACKLYCINKNALIIWQSEDLGIDGVVINNFSNNKIFGSGEWDPPGGWRDFVVEKFSGAQINQ